MRPDKRKDKAPHTADTRAKAGIKGFAGVPRCVIESEAYRTLSMMSRAILFEMVNRMKGNNNGKIHISYAELAYALNRRNQAPIGSAIAELMSHGLLDLSAESVWQERKSREYRLTFVNTSDAIGRPIKATNDYLQWSPRVKNDATDVVAGKRKTATTFVAGKLPAATDVVAEPNAKLPKTSEASATDGVVPICLPYPGAESEAAEPAHQPLISKPLSADDPVGLIREQLHQWWRVADVKGRQRLAKQHGLAIGDLLDFLDGRELPFPKLAAIRSSIVADRAAA